MSSEKTLYPEKLFKYISQLLKFFDRFWKLLFYKTWDFLKLINRAVREILRKLLYYRKIIKWNFNFYKNEPLQTLE